MITLTFGRPRIFVRKTVLKDGIEQEAPSFDWGSLFTLQNFVTLGAGVALGIILKQQSDIQSLKRTIGLLQGVFK